MISTMPAKPAVALLPPIAHIDGMSERAARTPSCPICGKPAVEKVRPFCSRRCADVDLNRWLSGSYAIAGKEEEDEDGAPSASSRDDGP
jgi:endogenous inhibitor of DNA gyrase (YacG/DUF329 family)